MLHSEAMKTLIKNALIIPMTQRNLSLRGDIGIDGTTIHHVGVTPPSFQPDSIVDAQDMIAMPALVNAHTHLGMELMRNYKDTCANLMDWLGEIFPIEDKLNANDLAVASQLGASELIRSGVTTFADMYFFAQETAQVVKDSGMRACLGLTLFGDLESSKQRVAERKPLVDAVAATADGRIRLDIAPHAIYTTTAQSYQFAHDYAKDNQVLLHTHLSETKAEVENSLREFGMTPGDYLRSLGVFDDIGSYMAHGVHLTEEEMDWFTDYRTAIVHNPTSNCKLASGIAPIGRMRSKSIPLALGTDGASSNNNLNMFEEMHVASLISTVSTGNPLAMAPYDILYMATAGGAQVLQLPQIGMLKPGMEADIILVDTNVCHLTPLNDPFSALVFGAQGSDVHSVWCKGRNLMKNRQLLTIDDQAAMAETKSAWMDILQRK